MRRIILALALGLCASGVAFADPPTPEPQASPGAIASGLIGDADAEGVFEIVPTEHLVAVRHIRSGLTCRMDPNNGNRLVIFPQAARGEDVACESSSDNHTTIKLYATRFSFRTNIADQVSGSVAAIQQRYPDARPFQIALRASSDGLPPSQTTHFLITEGGVQEYTRVSVAMIRGWVFKLRYTAPAANDAAAQRAALTADRIWAQTLDEIAHPH